MLCAPLSNEVRWIACVLCCIALTGCPQLQRDDFRIVASHPIGGRGGRGSAAGGSDGGASVSNGTGGTFGETSVGGTSATDASTEDVGGTSAADTFTGNISTGGTSAADTSTGGVPTGGTSAEGMLTAGSSATGTGGFDGTGGIGGSNSTGALCSPGSFGNVESILGLNVSGDLWSPSLSSDGSTLFFEVVDNNYNHVYAATRLDRGRTFLPPKLVTVDGAPSIQASPFLSADGKSLYFTTTTVRGSTDRDIWVASRTDTTTLTFSGAQVIASVNSTVLENRPWISPDQLTLLFASARTGGLGDNDIWMATRSSPSSLQFTVLPNLTTLNSHYRDGSGILSKDGLTLYFSSTRGTSGVGKLDIWTATRTTTNSMDFGSPAALTAVNNSGSEETDPALSQDETELFFVSDKSSTAQLFRATRNCAATDL